MLIAWAYISEFVLSSAIVYFLVLVFGVNKVVDFMRVAAADFATYFGSTMLAASLALFWTFYSKSDSDFMVWLEERRAYAVYLWAFNLSIAIYIVMLIAVTATKHTSDTIVALFAAWSSLLGIVATYSLLKNVSDLMRLNVLFNKKKNGP